MRKRMLNERRAQEEKYSRINRLKILNQWRKLMRLVKVEDLRKEIEIISQNHEREVDRKDAIIQAHRACHRTRLTTHHAPRTAHHAPRTTHHAPDARPGSRGLRGAVPDGAALALARGRPADRPAQRQDQARAAAAASPPSPASRSTRCPLCPRRHPFRTLPPRTPAHAPSTQPRRGIEFEFERDLQELVEEFGAEAREILARHAKHKKEMLDIMALMEAEFNEQEGEARQQFDSDREEIKGKNSEEYNVLRFTLEGLIEELERHFDSAHANYMATTEQRTQDFKHLTIKDQQSAKTIEMQMRKLQRLQDSLAHWKTKLASNGRECDERNRALREEKDAISRHFQELKSRMNKFRESEGRRLQELVINAQSALKALQAKLEKAERILRLAELARKLRPSPSPSLAPALALALALALTQP